MEAENVRRLYRLKLLTGKYMTTLINEAIQFYDEKIRTELNDRDELRTAEVFESLRRVVRQYDENRNRT